MIEATASIASASAGVKERPERPSVMVNLGGTVCYCENYRTAALDREGT